MESWREELYLSHHGIKGQKWGIRRFQNPDGTRTAEGKERYRDADYPKRTTNSQRRKMTNAELEARVKRLKLEKQVKDLEKETISSGKSVAEDILKSSGKKIATQLITAGAIAAVGAGITYAISRGATNQGGFVMPGMQRSEKSIEVLKAIKGAIPNAKNQW